MIKKASQLQEELQVIRGHIFYSFKEKDKYIENAVTYIVSGLKQGDYIVFIDNHKLFPPIQKKLTSLVSKEELAKIHWANNFDFYFSQGTFHPEVILKHFYKVIEPYVEKKVSVRTWGHVEWRDQKDVVYEIEKYEKKANEAFAFHQITGVCAYDADRMTETLKSSLMNCHEFFMTDDEIVKI